MFFLEIRVTGNGSEDNCLSVRVAVRTISSSFSVAVESITVCWATAFAKAIKLNTLINKYLHISLLRIILNKVRIYHLLLFRINKYKYFCRRIIFKKIQNEN